MQDRFEADNFLVDGKPAGGTVRGVGLSIDWQNGPLGAPDDPERQQPNGAFVETVIAATLLRLEHYQATQFHCEENARAILHLQGALDALNERTSRRVAANVEGTHEGN